MPSSLVYIFQFSIKKALISEATRYTATKVLDFSHSREVAIKYMLSKLPQSLDYKCNISDVSLLRARHYYTQHIRVLGVITSYVRCSSSNVELNSVELASIYKLKGDGVFVLPVSQQGSEYLVVHKSGKGLFYAILSNAWIDPILSMICNSCFNVIVSAKVKNNYISIHKGDKQRAIWGDAVSQQGEHFNVSVIPTTLLSDQITNWYSRYAYIVSLLLGSLFSFIFLIFLQKPLSYKSLISMALRNNEIVPYYQPIVDSYCNEIVGAEVLARWIRADGKIIHPSSFIKDVESSEHLSTMLAKRLIRQVCQDMQLIGERNKLWFSINVGAKNFMSDVLINYMSSIKEHSSGISFELTERQPLHDLYEVARYVNALRTLGHDIKIDDFGVGYSGFSYLLEINVDAIKIDKMFIDTIGTDDRKRKVLDSIILMAKENSYEIIAEGVENEEQIKYLSSKNVNFIQGNYYSAAVPFDEFLILINKSNQRKFDQSRACK